MYPNAVNILYIHSCPGGVGQGEGAECDIEGFVRLVATAGFKGKNVHDHRRERQSACCAQTATRAQAKGETDLGWIPSELHIIQGCLYALAGR